MSDSDGDMTEAEFVATWKRIMAHLTPTERDVVEAVVAGAAVNHALVYVAVAALLGLVGGWALHGLWG